MGEIGSGTYGTVYKAEDTWENKPVALKKMKIMEKNEGIPSYAIREITFLTQFNHPNIVKLMDVIVRPNNLEMIFEFHSEDLKNYLDNIPKEKFLSSLQIKFI